MSIELNFSALLMIPRPVIKTRNQGELAAIEQQMREKYPDLMKLWKPGSLSSYTNGEAYIAPHIFDKLCRSLQATTTFQYWKERGYECIEFDQLVQADDLGELHLSHIDIKSLFGMG